MYGLNIPVNLSDIVSGVTDTFQSLWPVLAFLAAIPLAFGVANRILGTTKAAARGRR